MEKKSCIAIVMALAFLLTAAPALANSIGNGGFETGDFTGWTDSHAPGGDADVKEHKDALGAGPGWDPTEGQYFAWLKTDGPGNETTLTSGAFSVQLNYWVEFDVYFDTDDSYSPPYNDYAYAKLIDSSQGETELYYMDAATVAATTGDRGWDGWTHVKHTFTSPGIYTLKFGVANTGDDTLDSALGVDGVFAVPEPCTVFLGIIGLGMTGWKARRRLGA